MTTARRSGSGRRCLRPLAILVGLASLAWILLRCLPKPARLTYPCQQAALGHVSLLLGIPVAHLVSKAVAGRAGRKVGLAVAIATVTVLILAAGLGNFSATELLARPIPLSGGEPDPLYRAEVFRVWNAGGHAGDHHDGVDALLAGLAARDLFFYESDSGSPESDPAGLVGADDIVLVKINSQWPERGGTNTDLLRGLIARILGHPDGFTGEIVVVENTQTMGTLDWPQANADDPGQSAQDVVDDFAGRGDPVGSVLWDEFRTVSVAEYADGDDADGYVVLPYDAATAMRPSYPKFGTPGGARVSLRHGVWDPDASTYDPERLVFLNVPVLKCHGAVYGVTGAVKHHVGTMTTTLATGTHAGVRTGGCGSFLAEVRRPDLNILDCIFVLARPDDGPWCTYGQATRLDQIVAGIDPVALDIWATVHLLVPAIQANGYTSWPMQDPENPDSIFRTYLDASMNRMLAAGLNVTNDLSRIDAFDIGSVSVDPPPPGPATTVLVRAAPNPFRDRTRLHLESGLPGEYRLEIHDITGRRVRTMIAGHAAGPCEWTWDGRDDAGRRQPAGTYAWRITGPDGVRTGKVTRLP